MASYQAKIGWKRLRKSENNFFSKNGKKIQKIKKYHCGFILSQNRLEKAGKERK